jgi:hypothetical protein
MGLVLVTPFGEPRPLPIRLVTRTWLGGDPRWSNLVFNQQRMDLVVNRIDEMAAQQRQRPWPPQSGQPLQTN